MKGIKMVAIDFDDTLCMNEEACFYFENHVANLLGHAPMSREAHQLDWGKPLELAIRDRVPGVDVQKYMELVKKELPLFVAEGNIDRLSKANLETLQRIKDSGKLLSILTSRSLVEAEHLLEPTHALSVFLDGFYHKDKTVFHKPDPRVFEMLLKDFNLTPHEVVYIGDTQNDAKAANGAGIRFIATLESGFRTREDFKECTVDHFIKRFSDLETIFA